MMKQAMTLCLIALLGTTGAWANQIAKGPLTSLPLVDRQHVLPPVAETSLAPLRIADGVDLIGDTVTVGTTWYEIQHNGSIGRMIALDSFGQIHCVWTNGLNASSTNRHVYYNMIDAGGQQGWPGVGDQVDVADRAGFTCLGMTYTGAAPYVAFHQNTGSSFYPHSAVADLIWGTFEIPWFQGQDLAHIWPRICLKNDGEFLVINTQSMPTMGVPMSQTWCVGHLENFQLVFSDQELLEYSMTVAAEVAASPVSNRVAAAWTTSRDPNFPSGLPTQYNNDIHMMIDDNGLNLNFDNWFNLTNFIYPDTSLLPDTLRANGDTLRAYTDVSLFFDQNDFCHAAFTTVGYYQLDSLVTTSASLIWHWSEERPNEFNLAANGWIVGPQPGQWNRYCQRPSLGQDPATGYLYCMYQRYDDSTVSAGGYPSGEVYISVSTDGGVNWSVGTNVTGTISPNGAAPGQCYSELCPSMAQVVGEFCHILYVLDRDAGNSQQNPPEGAATLNPVIYHRVPVDQIPTTPLVPQDIPFHVWPDTTAISQGNGMPADFALLEIAPNPFNPAAAIRFELRAASHVNLNVYDISGRLAATLVDGWREAGVHRITFNGSHLAAGIYFVRLRARGQSEFKKMVLLK